MSRHPLERSIDAIRAGRARRPDRQTRLGEFLPQLFDTEYAKPHRRLVEIVPIWESMVPRPLMDRTALASFARGVLTVKTDNSATQYELQRLLASGLGERLRSAVRFGNLRRIRLVVDSTLWPKPDDAV